MIQTIYTYKYFSERIDSIFLYPAREKDHIYEKLSVEDSLRDFFGNNFSINNLIRINTLDIPYIKKLNKRLWFYLLMISYCLNSIRFVASSKTKIWGLRIATLAKANNCFCPPDKFVPLSLNWV